MLRWSHGFALLHSAYERSENYMKSRRTKYVVIVHVNTRGVIRLGYYSAPFLSRVIVAASYKVVRKRPCIELGGGPWWDNWTAASKVKQLWRAWCTNADWRISNRRYLREAKEIENKWANKSSRASTKVLCSPDDEIAFLLTSLPEQREWLGFGRPHRNPRFRLTWDVANRFLVVSCMPHTSRNNIISCRGWVHVVAYENSTSTTKVHGLLTRLPGFGQQRENDMDSAIQRQ